MDNLKWEEKSEEKRSVVDKIQRFARKTLMVSTLAFGIGAGIGSIANAQQWRENFKEIPQPANMIQIEYNKYLPMNKENSDVVNYYSIHETTKDTEKNNKEKTKLDIRIKAIGNISINIKGDINTENIDQNSTDDYSYSVYGIQTKSNKKTRNENDGKDLQCGIIWPFYINNDKKETIGIGGGIINQENTNETSYTYNFNGKGLTYYFGNSTYITNSQSTQYDTTHEIGREKSNGWYFTGYIPTKFATISWTYSKTKGTIIQMSNYTSNLEITGNYFVDGNYYGLVTLTQNTSGGDLKEKKVEDKTNNLSLFFTPWKNTLIVLNGKDGKKTITDGVIKEIMEIRQVSLATKVKILKGLYGFGSYAYQETKNITKYPTEIIKETTPDQKVAFGVGVEF